eukprot:2656369-Rhodomonas_salina.1
MKLELGPDAKAGAGCDRCTWTGRRQGRCLCSPQMLTGWQSPCAPRPSFSKYRTRHKSDSSLCVSRWELAADAPDAALD